MMEEIAIVIGLGIGSFAGSLIMCIYWMKYGRPKDKIQKGI